MQHSTVNTSEPFASADTAVALQTPESHASLLGGLGWNAVVETIQDFAELRVSCDRLVERLELLAPDVSADSPLHACRCSLLSTLASIAQSGERINLQLRTILLGRCWERHGEWLIPKARQKRVQLKARLASCYRIAGTLAVSAEVQSPVYANSLPLLPLHEREEYYEHGWDYKRDRHLQARAYESRFATEYFGAGASDLKCYLTNSGMDAFTTVLHWLHGELGIRDRITTLLPCYFENRHLLEKWYGESLFTFTPDPETPERTEALLRAARPRVIIADTLVNTTGMNCLSLYRLIELASELATEEYPVIVVADLTCTPAALYTRLAEKVDTKRVWLFALESLAKYHQHGMDIVTGGILSAFMPQAAHENFWNTRARLGTNVCDSTPGALPEPDREVLLRRLGRMSRNTRLLASRLGALVCGPENLLEKIECGGSALATDEKFSGTILALTFKPEYRSAPLYREFETLVVEAAGRNGLYVRLSTSFGFDETRLYVTAPATIYEPPFLRVSVGIETEQEVLALGSAFADAERILRARIEARGLPALSEPLRKGSPYPGSRTSAVFSEESALAQFLDPDRYADTPLVELPPDLNPFADEGVRIYAKLMYLVPLLNIKSLPAHSMLRRAFQQGDLAGVTEIVESSSSNTILSLAVMARTFGIDRAKALVDHSLHPQLERMLRLFGISVAHHPGPGHADHGVVAPRSVRAATLGAEPGVYNPNQYANPDNPRAFSERLGPELWRQTSGKLSIISFGLGACGTVSGAGGILRTLAPGVKTIGCAPVAGEAVPGPREVKLLSDVAFPWRGFCSDIVELPAVEGYEGSLALLRRGIVAGPSSGLNYRGLVSVLGDMKRSGELDRLRASNGEVVSVFIACDSALSHIDEYFEYLGGEHFPPVEPWRGEAPHS